MIYKPISTAFLSSIGRHSVGSFAKDLGLHRIKSLGMAGGQTNIGSAFVDVSKFLYNMHEASRYLKIGSNMVIGAIDNSFNSPTNGSDPRLPYASASNISSLGKNDAIFYKTHTHVGRQSNKRIRSLQSNAFVQKLTKSTSSSSRDYQFHANRKHLTATAGFNEKAFMFLLDDTYFSVGDYYELFQIDKRFKQKFREDRDGVTEVYGAAIKCFNRLRIKNTMDAFSCHIKIHLIKIMDLETDPRSLVAEITHNNKQDSYDSVGKIPKDYQYTKNPDFDKKNHFSINFLTNLSCRLNLSSRFNERAQVVRSWSATLPPSSIWEFNLTTYLGEGIHLNYIYDLYHLRESNQNPVGQFQNLITTTVKDLKEGKNVTSKKKDLDLISDVISDSVIKEFKKYVSDSSGPREHPGSYCLCLEFVGDRRAAIQRKADFDTFGGYSPCKLNFEFDTELTFLAHDDDPQKLLTYSKIKQEKDFGPEMEELRDIFCPERELPFHVPFNDIGGNAKQKFMLQYDQAIASSGDIPSFLNNLRDQFKDLGLDPDSVSEDDAGLKFEPGDGGDDDDKPEL